MEIGDRIIWDSTIGYEIGYLKGYSGELICGETTIETVTGEYPGDLSADDSEIFPYSEELIDELTKRYGYEKRFSDKF